MSTSRREFVTRAAAGVVGTAAAATVVTAVTAVTAVDPHFVGADAMPERNDAEGDRPVPGILPNGSIAVVHELVAVVLEFLAEEIEHGPTFMTGGATQAVLPGKGRESARRLTGAQDQED